MGQDGALWFTENSGNKIERITTAGVITEFPVPTSSSGPRGIVAGPDGARDEFLLAATAQNLRKLAKLIPPHRLKLA